MPPSLTVRAVRDAQRGKVAADVARTTAQLSATDSDLTKSRAAVTSATDTLAVTQAAEARLRQQIAAALMPAETHALELQLEDNLLAQRPQLAALASARDLVATTERARQRVATALDRARGQLAGATADAVVADKDDTDATRWRDALSGTALRDMVTKAAGPEVAAEVSAATSRLGALLGGQELVELLKRRLDNAASEAAERAGAVTRATEALDTLRATLAPTEGAVLLAADRFARVRDDVRAVVELGPQRLVDAQTALHTAATAADLTAGEQARINARASDAKGGAPSPVVKEQGLLDATIALRRAKADFEAKALVEEAKNPGFDRDTDPALDGERQAREQAQTAFDEKSGAFSDGDKAAIDRWEVAVPPTAMAGAVEAVRAVAAIDALKNTNLNAAGGLLERLDQAEETYAKALQGELDAGAREEAAAALVAERLDAQAVLAAVADLRLVAAVRGDE